MENLVLIAIHLVPFLVLLTICQFKSHIAHDPRYLIPGFLCVPFFGFIILVLLDTSNHGGNGTHGTWFLILSAVTLGILPIVSLTSAAISGICAARVIEAFRSRNLSKRQAESF